MMLRPLVIPSDPSLKLAAAPSSGGPREPTLALLPALLSELSELSDLSDLSDLSELERLYTIYVSCLSKSDRLYVCVRVGVRLFMAF